MLQEHIGRMISKVPTACVEEQKKIEISLVFPEVPVDNGLIIVVASDEVAPVIPADFIEEPKLHAFSAHGEELLGDIGGLAGVDARGSNVARLCTVENDAQASFGASLPDRAREDGVLGGLVARPGVVWRKAGNVALGEGISDADLGVALNGVRIEDAEVGAPLAGIAGGVAPVPVGSIQEIDPSFSLKGDDDGAVALGVESAVELVGVPSKDVELEEGLAGGEAVALELCSESTMKRVSALWRQLVSHAELA